jgi:hypothetical protein
MPGVGLKVRSKTCVTSFLLTRSVTMMVEQRVP